LLSWTTWEDPLLKFEFKAVAAEIWDANMVFEAPLSPILTLAFEANCAPSEYIARRPKLVAARFKSP
jgi:hypothetical protein